MLGKLSTQRKSNRSFHPISFFTFYFYISQRIISSCLRQSETPLLVSRHFQLAPCVVAQGPVAFVSDRSQPSCWRSLLPLYRQAAFRLWRGQRRNCAEAFPASPIRLSLQSCVCSPEHFGSSPPFLVSNSFFCVALTRPSTTPRLWCGA